MIKGYITLKQASELSGKEVEALKKQCQDGRIRGAIKQGKAWFVPLSEILVNDSTIGNGTLNFLLSLVDSAGDGTNMGITLYIQGAIVEGTLISRKEYIQYFRNTILDTVKINFSDSKQETTNKFQEFTQKYFDELEKADDVGIPSFVHLKDVSSSQIANGATSNGSYLRIKYEAVDGFILGNTRPKVEG